MKQQILATMTQWSLRHIDTIFEYGRQCEGTICGQLWVTLNMQEPTDSLDLKLELHLTTPQLPRTRVLPQIFEDLVSMGF